MDKNKKDKNYKCRYAKIGETNKKEYVKMKNISVNKLIVLF